MGFRDEFDQHQKENAMNGEFFKFKKDGDYKFRIMCEPVKKVSRFPHGICYEGAPYCTKQALEADYKVAQEKATAAGKDPKKVAMPSLSIKWMVWAYSFDTESFVILDMANAIATALRTYMDSDEYGFKEFPMPYNITVTAKNAGTKEEVEYTVMAARQNTELDPNLLEDYAKLTPIQQIKERLQAKQKDRMEGTATTGPASPIDYPDEDINAEDIPF